MMGGDPFSFMVGFVFGCLAVTAMCAAVYWKQASRETRRLKK